MAKTKTSKKPKSFLDEMHIAQIAEGGRVSDLKIPTLSRTKVMKYFFEALAEGDEETCQDLVIAYLLQKRADGTLRELNLSKQQISHLLKKGANPTLSTLARVFTEKRTLVPAAMTPSALAISRPEVIKKLVLYFKNNQLKKMKKELKKRAPKSKLMFKHEFDKTGFHLHMVVKD